MKILIFIVLFTGLSANMFDEMSDRFVQQMEDMTDTSNLSVTKEIDYSHKEQERKDKQKELRKEKELQSFQVKIDNMNDKIDTKKQLKKEVSRGGNTYLGITMNKKTSLAQKTKYLGLDREWTRRTNTNGVGTVTLSGFLLEENIVKYNQYIQSKYTFVNKRTYKTPSLNRATTQSIYSNNGDKIIFNVHTTKYKDPTFYKMEIKYISKEELFSRN